MVDAYKNLTESRVYEKLVTLAENPFDMTEPQALQADNRLARYVCRRQLLHLHYGTERINDRVLDGLQLLADELRLVEQFGQMRRGAVLNRIEGFDSENRRVLHTASRDLFSTAPAEPAASGDAKKELDKLNGFLEDLETGRICNHRGERFDTMIQVGIGGSDLGPRATYEALKSYEIPGRKVHFIANVDPDDAAAVLANVNLARTLINIVSKSGTTQETLTNEHHVRLALTRAGLDPSKHCIAVTGRKSPMDNPDKYLQSFFMFDYIGGRYSSTSMVGAVMLGFALGFSQVREFLHGAALADSDAEELDIRKNIPLLLALLGIWNHTFLGYPTLAVLPYSQALHRFPAHLQQCDMESNGKSVDRQGRGVQTKTGPVIWGEPGTNGQHAFYQLLHQGTEIVPVEFIGFLRCQYGFDTVVEGSTSQQKLLANLFAQMIAMAVGQPSANPNRSFSGNRPSCLLFAEKLTPLVMGALLATYEAKIVFQGFAWNINSFDQEGVQLGKALASGFLRVMNDPSGTSETLEKTFLNQVLEMA
ncbi:MAG: glucose-6-phosphate isomerase [Desulfobulbaceae bacterium BRH_c16a]|nr:MAG: glucose-6-phosphate isomerase [Desulfobulbaceae bacterium BRH_c16a]